MSWQQAGCDLAVSRGLLLSLSHAAACFSLPTQAYEVLGDPASRQQYDQELQDAALSSGFK